MIQLFSYRPRQFVFHLRCFLLIWCAQDISTDVLIVIMHEKNKTESMVYIRVYQEMESTLLLCMYGAERRDRRLSLFGGLCSQTVPPSNYVYIELSARIDASPALSCLHGLSSTPLHLVSSYGKGQRVQMSGRRFT